jgi:hypothetical protein
VSACPWAGPVSVTTYHYDNMRTGWNQGEKTLTPAKVKSKKFQLLASTTLDDQVDAQPLILGNQAVNGNSAREVVYIATESNTIYAIDGNTGSVLLSKNFGTPVLRSSLPGQCTNGGPNLGINATPTIDPATHTIYFITYTQEAGKPVYRIHGIDPSTLTDTITPVVISASAKLTNGTTFAFDPHEARNRAALLLANGNIYAGFASFCDYDADKSRGWVLGWNASTFAPLPSNEMTNALPSSTDDFFLSSIWMSGFGLAASMSGDIYFVTGNSDYSGDSYDAKHNIAESVVQLSADLDDGEEPLHAEGDEGWQNLDEEDADFGSGGVDAAAAAAGSADANIARRRRQGRQHVRPQRRQSRQRQEDGRQGVLHRECRKLLVRAVLLHGQRRLRPRGVERQQLRRRVAYRCVGRQAETGLEAAARQCRRLAVPGLLHLGLVERHDEGNSAVVWAVGRPTDNDPANISLYAFNPDKQGTLFSAVAGSWPNTGGDSNIVPVVANGKVYRGGRPVARDLRPRRQGAQSHPAGAQAHRHAHRAGAGRARALRPHRADLGRHGLGACARRTPGRRGHHGGEVQVRFRQAVDRSRAHGARNLRGQRHDESRPRRPRQGQREDVAVG